MPFFGAISASKAALASVTDALRMELKPFNVDVALVEPPAMQTKIFDKAARRAEEDRAAAPPDVHALYAPAWTAANEAIADQQEQASPVDVAVDAVVSVLTDRNPQIHYRVGRETKLGGLVNLLPNRWQDRVLMSTMNLTDELFQSVNSDDSN